MKNELVDHSRTIVACYIYYSLILYGWMKLANAYRSELRSKARKTLRKSVREAQCCAYAAEGPSTGADCTRIIFDLRRSMDHSLHTERRKNENDRVQGDVKVDVFSKSLRGAV